MTTEKTKPTRMKDAITKQFLACRALGQKAMVQLNDADVHWRRSEDDNSVFVLVSHLHGNMLSRFTDFMGSDGEKPWRDRDGEFMAANGSRKKMMELWDEGWDCLLQALRPLSDEDMGKTVTIRNEPHTVADALLGQLTHYSGHVGQIIYITKMVKGQDWKTLSIPRAADRPSPDPAKK